MANKPVVNIGLIGQKFMGRAHSNAWGQVSRFFDPPVIPVQHTIAARDAGELGHFGPLWGWIHASTDWKAMVRDEAIDLVDIVTPNHLHPEMTIAALEAGKDVACEKPLARTLDEARAMRDAARKHRRSRTFVWYNYRRTPAVALAHQLVREGRIGRIRHVRAYYLQDWATPDVPLIWRFDKGVAGSGSHGDLNAHIIDMVRFVTGEEITDICGAMFETFVKERTLPAAGSAGGIAAGSKGSAKKGKVRVDDAVLALTRLSGGGMASFEATRFATGNQNKNGLEVNGEKGAIRFDFERMNYLEYYDATRERKVQGWAQIIVTHGGDHPYAEAYWPDAHVIGYEHSFINQAYDMLRVLGGEEPVVPLPDFEDAYQTQRVLEAMSLAGRERCWVKLSQVK